LAAGVGDPVVDWPAGLLFRHRGGWGWRGDHRAGRAGVLGGAGPGAEGDFVEVAAEGGAFDAEQGGDLFDGVFALVVEPLSLADLGGGELGAPARPSRVLATISSRWNSASTDSIPNMARPSAVSVSILCSSTFSLMPSSRSSAPKVTR
jgi:hypothetical protein